MASLSKRAATCSLSLLGGLFAACPALAEEKLALPPTQTQGKPVSPPAPVEGITPKLGGLNALVGVALIDLGPVNERLSATGYPHELPLAFPLVGGQGFGLFSRFLIGGSGMAFLSRSVSAPGREVSANGAFGTFDFGYQLLRINGLLVAPIASLGGYGMEVTLRSKSDTSFDEALASPTRATTLTNKGIVAGLSVMANLVVLGRRDDVPNARSGWTLGLRLGALYGVPYRDWKADGVKVSDGPTLGLRGGYAALSLGIGTW